MCCGGDSGESLGDPIRSSGAARAAADRKISPKKKKVHAQLLQESEIPGMPKTSKFSSKSKIAGMHRNEMHN